MVSQSKARQIKAKRSLAWQIFSHVRFVFVASVHDILVRISFKEIFLTGFVDHSCFSLQSVSMTLARRYEWSGTPLTAGQGPAAAHLQATASAADLSGLANCWLQPSRLLARI